MVKLYLKQKVFSWKTRFTVKDAQERDCFFVEGEMFSIGKRLHIYDAGGNEVALLQQKAFAFMPRFTLFVGGEPVAQIVKEMSFVRVKYRVEGLDWQLSGDFWEHQYEITKHGLLVAAVHKDWLSWGDSYAIEIAHSEDTITALSVVLAIDCVQEQQAVAASAAT